MNLIDNPVHTYPETVFPFAALQPFHPVRAGHKCQGLNGGDDCC